MWSEEAKVRTFPGSNCHLELRSFSKPILVACRTVSCGQQEGRRALFSCHLPAVGSSVFPKTWRYVGVFHTSKSNFLLMKGPRPLLRAHLSRLESLGWMIIFTILTGWEKDPIGDVQSGVRIVCILLEFRLPHPQCNHRSGSTNIWF